MLSLQTPHNNLRVLRNRNIVVTRKDGANVYYSVSDKSIFKLLDAAKEIFNNHLVGVRSMLEEIHEPAKQSKAPSAITTSSLDECFNSLTVQRRKRTVPGEGRRRAVCPLRSLRFTA